MSSLKWFTLNGPGNILTYTGSWNVTGDINFGGNIYQNGVPLSIGSGGSTQWTSVFGSGIYYNGPVVGIGKTDPDTAYKLDVNGDINLSGDIYKNGVIIAGSTGGGALLWGENGGELFTLVNVGIGTNNPSNPLHVASTSTTFDVSRGIRLGDNTDFATFNYIKPTLGLEYLLIQSTKTGVGNNRNIALNPVGGNVGIGLTNPAFKLDLNGDINMTGDFYKNGILYTPWVSAQLFTQSPLNAFNYYYVDGNIGIGTTDPQYSLHVDGQTRIEDVIITNTTVSTLTSLTLSTPGDINLNSNVGSKIILNNTTTVPGNFVGIGTTNPQKPLHIYSSVNPARLQSTVDGCYVEFFTPGYNSSNTRAGYIGYNNSAAQELRIYNEAPGNLILTTIFPYNITLERPLFIPTTLTPLAGWTSVTQDDSKILFYNGGGSNWSGMGVDTAGKWWLRTGTASQNLLVMDGTGNIGIGTTNPQGYKVRVNGDIYSTNTLKAFVTFYWDGTSVQVINVYNIFTIARSSQGIYVINFYSTTMPSANYGHVSGAGLGPTANPIYCNRIIRTSSTQCTVHWGSAHASGVPEQLYDPVSSTSPVSIAFFATV